MAEAVGLATSIIGVVQLAGQVAILGWGYIGGVNRASKDIRNFAEELGNLEGVLSAVLDCVEDSGSSTALENLSWKGGALEKCVDRLGSLQAKLAPKQGFKGAINSLKWPLKESETSQCILWIERQKSLFNLALSADNNTRSMAIQKDVKKAFISVQGIEKVSLSTNIAFQGFQDGIATKQRQEDIRVQKKIRGEVLDWIYPGDFDVRHVQVKGMRHEGTGQWLPKRPEFEEWSRGRNCRLLWGYGIPGAGKTFLSSVIIDYFESRARSEGYGVAHIYFNYKEQESQKPIQVLSSLVKQLANQIPALPIKIGQLYDEMQTRGKPTIEQLYDSLLEILESFTQVFFIFDALDECHPETQRNKLLPLFNRMGEDGICVFLTSRPHPEDIKKSLSSVVRIELSAQEEDITAYIRQKIKGNSRTRSLVEQGNYESKIISGLVDCAQGMFLLVHFHIEYLCQQINPKAILKALDNIKSPGAAALDLAYKRAVTNIRNQPKSSSDLAFKILSWLAKTRRTLTIKELQTAVAVEPGRYELDALDLSAPETLVDVCASLVTTDGDTIRLAHYTIQEYLLTGEILPDTADFDIAMACTTYLSFDSLSAGVCASDEALGDRVNSHPFLDYAAQHLNSHLRVCDDESSTDMYLRFVRNPNSVSSWRQYLCYAEGWRGRFLHRVLEARLRSPLHIASALGHLAATRALLEGGEDILMRDSKGNTVLHIAVKQGHEMVVGLLLEKGINTMAKNMYGNTALHYAVGGGRKAIIELLLNKATTADIATQSKDGCTALHYAVQGKHKTVAGLLLDKGADISTQNEDGYTALHCAVREGHEEMVKLLLNGATPVDIAAQSKDGYTALHYAVKGKHEAVVGLLLDKGADIAARSEDGYTALQYAVQGGHEDMVKLLLNGATPAGVAAQSKYGYTALHYAVQGKYKTTVELLLDKGAEISAQNEYGYTPLHYAAWAGYNTLVGLLLDRGADISSRDENGYTALLCAVFGGKRHAVRFLLDKGADISVLDKRGRTALDIASEGNHQGVVDLLLERGCPAAQRVESEILPLVSSDYPVPQTSEGADTHDNPRKEPEFLLTIEPSTPPPSVSSVKRLSTILEIPREQQENERLPAQDKDERECSPLAFSDEGLGSQSLKEIVAARVDTEMDTHDDSKPKPESPSIAEADLLPQLTPPTEHLPTVLEISQLQDESQRSSFGIGGRIYSKQVTGAWMGFMKEIVVQAFLAGVFVCLFLLFLLLMWFRFLLEMGSVIYEAGRRKW